MSKGQLNVLIGNKAKSALSKIAHDWGTTQSDVVSVLIMHHYLKHYEEDVEDVMRLAYIETRKQEDAILPPEQAQLPAGFGRPVDFIQDRCTKDHRLSTQASIAFETYKSWCQVVKRRPLNSRAFKREMERMGHYSVRRANGNYYLGIEVNY